MITGAIIGFIIAMAWFTYIDVTVPGDWNWSRVFLLTFWCVVICSGIGRLLS